MKLPAPVALIVGLGNPGPEHEATRHNAGFWFADGLAARGGVVLRPESRFHGELGHIHVDGHDCRLLKPATFMNRSGQSVAATAHYFRIPPEAILVAHDELDLPPGVVRLKQGGGHGGHNGLRDIMAALGSRDFLRLRVGIGHPGDSRQVTPYVLGRPPPAELAAIEDGLRRVEGSLGLILAGETGKVMNSLHR